MEDQNQNQQPETVLDKIEEVKTEIETRISLEEKFASLVKTLADHGIHLEG